MKRFVIFLGLVLSIVISTKIVAKDESCLAQNNYQRANYLQSYYDDFYEQALKVDIKEITKTEDVYPYILKHKELIKIRNSKVIFDYEKSNLNDIEISLVKQTIGALQYMMDTNEVVFDEDLRIIDVGYLENKTPKKSILFANEKKCDSVRDNCTREGELQGSYDHLYEQALKTDIKKITRTEDVYPYILKHKELVEVRNSKVIFDYEKSDLDDIEITFVKQIIDALQYLIDNNEIVLDEDLRMIDVGYWDPKESSSHENSNREHVYATSFDLFRECDDHVQEFKQYVYVTSKLGTSFINHWIWFARKVKPNGEWDYKVNLGWNTYYSCYNLGRMSGETIGNFHYGYVGSYYFSPSTLKYLSRIVNVITNGLDRDIEYYYLDDPKDIRDIEWGIDVYRRRN